MGNSFSFDFFLHIIFFLNHCQSLETSSFRARRADFVYLFVFCGFALTLIAFAGGFLFMSSAFSFAITYIWSRRNPDVQMAFFGILNFRAPYLPYVMLLFSVLTGGDMTTDIIGLVVGHIYYYLEDVYPFMTTSRVRLLQTPSFLSWLFRERPVTPTVVAPTVLRPVQANANVIQQNMLRMAQLRQQGLLAASTRNATGTEPSTTPTATVASSSSMINHVDLEYPSSTVTTVEDEASTKKDDIVKDGDENGDVDVDDWDAWPTRDLYASENRGRTPGVE